MITQASIREISDAIAAPAAPMPQPKIKMAFPTIFTAFMSMEISMVIFELPMERKIAAPLL